MAMEEGHPLDVSPLLPFIYLFIFLPPFKNEKQALDLSLVWFSVLIIRNKH